jgi:arylformamidase
MEVGESLGAMRWVDLSHTLRPSMPVYPGHPQFASIPWHAGDAVHMNQLLIGEHMGTHLDSPSHIYPDAADPRHLTVAELPLRSLAGPAVKLDFGGLEGGTLIGPREIRDREADHRHITPDAVVICQFGWSVKWSSIADPEYIASWPGLSEAGAAYLVDRGVRMVGTDCLGIDGSSADGLPAHETLLGNGVPIVENLANLDEVPAAFFFMALPLRIDGGTGSPVRAVALVP